MGKLNNVRVRAQRLQAWKIYCAKRKSNLERLLRRLSPSPSVSNGACSLKCPLSFGFVPEKHCSGCALLFHLCCQPQIDGHVSSILCLDCRRKVHKRIIGSHARRRARTEQNRTSAVSNSQGPKRIGKSGNRNGRRSLVTDSSRATGVTLASGQIFAKVPQGIVTIGPNTFIVMQRGSAEHEKKELQTPGPSKTSTLLKGNEAKMHKIVESVSGQPDMKIFSVQSHDRSLDAGLRSPPPLIDLTDELSKSSEIEIISNIKPNRKRNDSGSSSSSVQIIGEVNPRTPSLSRVLNAGLIPKQEPGTWKPEAGPILPPLITNCGKNTTEISVKRIYPQQMARLAPFKQLAPVPTYITIKPILLQESVVTTTTPFNYSRPMKTCDMSKNAAASAQKWPNGHGCGWPSVNSGQKRPGMAPASTVGQRKQVWTFDPVAFNKMYGPTLTIEAVKEEAQQAPMPIQQQEPDIITLARVNNTGHTFTICHVKQEPVAWSPIMSNGENDHLYARH